MILVTGFPRSGTGSAHKMLQANGEDIGHEVIGRDGISSWAHCASGTLPWLKDPVIDLRPHADHVVHLVRFPLDVVASASILTEAAVKYMQLNLGKIPPKQFGIEHMVELYLDWNERIERGEYKHYFFQRVEDLTNDASVLVFLGALEIQVPRFQHMAAPKDYNARPHNPLNWRHVRESCPPELYERFVAKTREYGYPVPTEQKLTLCFMGKDEQGYMKTMLESAKAVSGPNGKFYDEAIYLDTGSSDRSVELAKANGCRVIETKWKDDFSYHRNQLMDQVQAGFVLMIDCDEQFRGDFSNLKSLLADVPYNIDALRIQMLDMKNGKQELAWNPEKIFRPGKVRYKYRVHNKPQWEGYAPLYIDGWIEHYGYDVPKEKMDAKMVRTKRLLEMRLTDDPNDHEVFFYLFQIDIHQEKYEDALEKAETYLNRMDKAAGINKSIYLPYCELLFRLKKYQKLEGVYN